MSNEKKEIAKEYTWYKTICELKKRKNTYVILDTSMHGKSLKTYGRDTYQLQTNGYLMEKKGRERDGVRRTDSIMTL